MSKLLFESKKECCDYFNSTLNIPVGYRDCISKYILKRITELVINSRSQFLLQVYAINFKRYNEISVCFGVLMLNYNPLKYSEFDYIVNNFIYSQYEHISYLSSYSDLSKMGLDMGFLSRTSDTYNIQGLFVFDMNDFRKV